MIGKRIGNYVVKAALGSGGMGQVFLAEHERIKSRAAIKVLWQRGEGNRHGDGGGSRKALAGTRK